MERLCVEAGNTPLHAEESQQWEGVADWFSTLWRNTGSFLSCRHIMMTHRARVASPWQARARAGDPPQPAHTRTHTHSEWSCGCNTRAPSATNRHITDRGWGALTHSSGLSSQGSTVHGPRCYLHTGRVVIKQRGGGGSGPCAEPWHRHMLNSTYMWYSSIASTNCPHESKSVAFLKLQSHFCTVLLTSDMLAGAGVLCSQGSIAEEEAPPRGGGGGRGVVRQVGLLLQLRRLTHTQTHTDTHSGDTPTKPFLSDPPGHRGSPAWNSGVRAIRDAGSPGWIEAVCL